MKNSTVNMKALRTFVYNVLCLKSGSQKIKDFKTPCPALFVTKTRQHHFQDDAQLGRIVDCWTAIHLGRVAQNPIKLTQG